MKAVVVTNTNEYGIEPFDDKTAQGPIHISPKASDVVCVNLLDVLS